MSVEAGGLDDQELNRWLDDRLKRVVYGATEEAVRNAMRHARGSRLQPLAIVVQLRRDESGLTVMIQDNGIGFEPAAVEFESRGMGLHYHHAAMRAVGGSLQVESQRHQGTTVRLHIPTPVLCHQLPSCPFNPAATTIARSRLAWARIILETERLPGGRLLVNDDLSDVTRPPLVSEQYYLRHAAEPERSALLTIEHERQQLFTAQLAAYPYREIVDQRRLERYIATGTLDSGRIQIGVELAREHILAVITILRTQPNYELALSDMPFETNFLIKPGHAVLWEQRAEDGESTIDGFLEGVRDTDRGTVANFEQRFAAAWERIPKERRRKESVIQWLENRLQAREGRQLSLWDISLEHL